MRSTRLSSLLCVTLASCADGAVDGADCVNSTCQAATAACADFDSLRRPLFGDAHVHTTLSFDANVRGTRLRPSDAFRFARGERVDLPPYDRDGRALRNVQRGRPLDWAAVTDHAEYLGAVSQCRDPAAAAYEHPSCVALRTDPNGTSLFGASLAALPESASYPTLCGDEAFLCLESGLDVWTAYLAETEAANDTTPACEFATLVGYEWTGAPGLRNLHRNVIFRGANIPAQPVGYFDASYVEELWRLLREDCIESGLDCDALTIPHNSNLSAGLMFERWNRAGDEPDAEYARERARMEPIVEIYQHKGDSECLPGTAAADELCDFEKIPGERLGYATSPFSPPVSSGFVRDALGLGLEALRALGANPFQFGLIASTDTHIATPGHTVEDAYAGHGDIAAGATEFAFAEGLVDYPFNGPGGLAVVWAEENSRDAIFAAMQRREVYGTSGTHIIVRFFAGWTYPDSLCASANLAEVGYADGVPMGGVLDVRPEGHSAPVFILSAAQDPGTESAPGTPLQRIQIVKGSLDDDGAFRVQTYDVGGNPDNRASVDPSTCAADAGDGGFAELCSVWRDPDFDAERPAFYYARVVENPVCRWSTHACNAAGVDCAGPPVPPEFEPCCDPSLPKEIQERAWTSPIWFEP